MLAQIRAKAQAEQDALKQAHADTDAELETFKNLLAEEQRCGVLPPEPVALCLRQALAPCAQSLRCTHAVRARIWCFAICPGL